MTRDGTVGRSDATERSLPFHWDIDPARVMRPRPPTCSHGHMNRKPAQHRSLGAMSKQRSGGRTICFVAVCKSVPRGASAPRRNELRRWGSAARAGSLADVPARPGMLGTRGCVTILRSDRSAPGASSTYHQLARLLQLGVGLACLARNPFRVEMSKRARPGRHTTGGAEAT
jgi:hypothetical protein